MYLLSIRGTEITCTKTVRNLTLEKYRRRRVAVEEVVAAVAMFGPLNLHSVECQSGEEAANLTRHCC